MDNKDIQVLSHGIEITDRKIVKMNGIKKIENFNKEEFFLLSVMGYILVRGDNLELMKLDTVGGNVHIKGIINSINYLDEDKKKNKESLLSRLFK